MKRGWRRLFVVGCCFAVLSTHAEEAVETAIGGDDVKIERAGKRFTVDVQFLVPVRRAVAWAVVTDFEHMTEFIPNLTLSQVVSRGHDSVRIRQKAVGYLGPFPVEVESVREVQMSHPREIRARGVGGNVEKIESVMTLEAVGEGTQIRYHVEAEPDFWFPPLIGPAMVRKKTVEQFTALIAEMRRRR